VKNQVTEGGQWPILGSVYLKKLCEKCAPFCASVFRRL